ncbi:Putative RNA recognition motif domain, nucleotide-binding alpha-beta plait domain superfamily [Septoria linicola]|uniref:RNA recognition motif domain, nucleotide-binding alpha-beta plait domain superfamily n=1 Tax=Septoria linicola TaxID=215465 RepID=A0A9Q9AIF4_9PEZI|nr:putative RNA recognition motif domain, nucleotide-binding alpha-beta plait domain superfamily [Septoria linicola]USW47513.1 Putative RNA recognition motif domain, nucleotide-binding alpha-beta plait domain superfamily [Septoria linicola]
MFALRRVAARALQFQPTRQLSTLGMNASASRIEISRPSIYRSFHQSRQWLAESTERSQTESPAEKQGGETVTVEPSAQEQKEVKEESVATPEVADAADGKAPASNVAEEVTQKARNATDAAKDAVSSVAQTVSNTASRAANAAGVPRFPPNNTGAPGQPTKILYVGNLFFEVNTAQLEAEFGRFGEVVNSRIVTDPKGMSKGFGYIEFADQEAADRSIRELDQKVFQGRRLAVQYHVRRESRNRDRGFKRENPPSKTLFIGNMSYQMSDRDLNDLFREIRNVLDVRVAIDRRSGQPRGFAHADFIDIASAEKAKEHLGQKVVYGRQLRVDFSASSNDSPPAA